MRQPRRVYVRRRVLVASGFALICFSIGLAAAALLHARVDRPGVAPAAASGSDSPGSGGDQSGDEYRQAGWVERENAQPGSADWRIPDDPDVWSQIRGFADQVSVDREGTVTLYVDTEAPTFDVQAYRMGWYGSLGGRLIWESKGVAGTEQPEADRDRSTNTTIATNWTPSVEVPVARDWPPGTYLFVLRTPDGGASYIPLTVRDDESTADLLIMNSVTTWQAYNQYGKGSLYFGSPGRDPDTRAQVVSFDRPYDRAGAGQFLSFEHPLIGLAERYGFDVTYWTNIDLHEQPELALQHRAVISLGHDEYYTTTMRDGLEDARDHGVNIAFFGANAVYRRIRLEDSAFGPNRLVVNYRVAADDPLYGLDNENVTTSFREPPEARPESSLVGNYYECNPVNADMVIVDSNSWFFEGTGLEDGDIFGGLVGDEYDRVTPEVSTPDNIQVIAHSPVECKGVDSYSDVAYYTADSGAGVFSSGTAWWIGQHLLTVCSEGDVDRLSPCQIQTTTRNILSAFAEGPAGDEHPSESNLDDLGIERGYISPAPK